MLARSNEFVYERFLIQNDIIDTNDDLCFDVSKKVIKWYKI